MMPGMQIVHRLNRDHDERVSPRLASTVPQPQFELPTAGNHVANHLVNHVLVLPGPVRNGLANLVTVLSQKTGGGRIAPEFHGIRKETQQVAIENLGNVEQVTLALLFVMLAECSGLLSERPGMLSGRHQRLLAPKFIEQFIDKFELLAGGPAFVLGPPARARLEPDGESFGEIFGGVALRVPRVEVQHETLAVRTRLIVLRIGLG